jgi:hypothetical protein
MLVRKCSGPLFRCSMEGLVAAKRSIRMRQNKGEREASPSHPAQRSPFDEIHWVGIALVSLGIGVVVFLLYVAWLIGNIKWTG